MASLDDFFAKKDKSKKKKSKLTPSDISTKQESTGATPVQILEKKKKEKPAKSEKSDSQQNAASESKKEDAEWADYVPEQEADYSGLRIQTLMVKEDAEEDSRESGGEEENEDGERRDGKDASGPWRPKSKSKQPPPEPEPVKEPEPVAAPPAEPVKTGKYIPPSMRHGNQSSGSSGISTSSVNHPLYRRGRGKNAPNLQSEEDFPTLGTIEPACDGGALFEKVRSGGRQAEESSGKGGMKIQLGNKFDALENDPEPIEEPEPAKPAKTGKYIPPSMRHGNQSSGYSGIK